MAAVVVAVDSDFGGGGCGYKYSIASVKPLVNYVYLSVHFRRKVFLAVKK